MTDDAPHAGLLDVLRLEARKNWPDVKSVFVVAAFRLTSHARQRLTGPFRPLYWIIACGYRLTIEWVLGIEIPPSTRIGAGLRLHHGVGTVINPSSRLGRNVELRHGVTIGNNGRNPDCPIVGDDVEFGAYSMAIGGIHIGDGATIGAGAVVVDDVPAGAVMVGPRATARASDPRRQRP